MIGFLNRRLAMKVLRIRSILETHRNARTYTSENLLIFSWPASYSILFLCQSLDRRHETRHRLPFFTHERETKYNFLSFSYCSLGRSRHRHTLVHIDVTFILNAEKQKRREKRRRRRRRRKEGPSTSNGRIPVDKDNAH